MATTQERNPHISINRSKGRNQCFDERLGKNVRLRMMQIPSGRFVMGSPETEPEYRQSESPQHKVVVQSFFMGKYPITQAQWRFMAKLRVVNRKLAPDPSNFKGDNRPVEQVSWRDAVEFCDRLSRYTKREYRLPTEAEWEYACRAGTDTPFHFGETISPELANYRGTGIYNNGPAGEYREETTSVDYFDVANAWGLCDMHGNVCEWCQDHWHDNYNGAPTDGSVWLSSGSVENYILRGGAWGFLPRDCRSASRLSYPDDRHLSFGFRVVVSAPRTLQTRTR